MSAAELLAKLRTLQGYRPTAELGRIEKEFGEGLCKTLQEQIVSLDRADTEKMECRTNCPKRRTRRQRKY
jgi:hypothetical protein